MWIKPLQKPLPQAIEIRKLEFGRPFRFAYNPEDIRLYMVIDHGRYEIHYNGRKICDPTYTSDNVSYVNMIDGGLFYAEGGALVIPKHGIFVEMTEDEQEEQTGISKS